MKAFIWRYVPYLVAAFMVANGFYTLAMGLGEIFHLDRYLAVELGEMRRYLEVVPAPQLGGFVAVFLGVVFIVLGKGLAERRRRARNWAVVALLLNVLSHLYQGLPLRNCILSAAGLVLLGLLRAEFTRHSERHRWSYAEVIAVLSIIFALAYGIGGAYLLRAEFSGIETWTDAVYFTVVTYSTLGYGDILPQSTNAKWFAISTMGIGIGSFITALTVLLGPLIENRLKGVFAVVSKFQKSVDHIVVCGYTKVTESIVDELRTRQVPFLIIDEREDFVVHLKNSGLDVLQGDPTERAVLEQANLSSATAVIAATDSDATNTLVALTARALREAGEQHKLRIVVRIEDEENIAKVQSISVDEIISPSTLGGRLMAQRAVGAGESVDHG
ncbi:MAG: NAD-binding protein [Gemmatimonadetes bacterium]|nr:NAD-binding protein [Gemmatimonadota bacterium]